MVTICDSKCILKLKTKKLKKNNNNNTNLTVGSVAMKKERAGITPSIPTSTRVTTP
jgi:hypothetical protein